MQYRGGSRGEGGDQSGRSRYPPYGPGYGYAPYGAPYGGPGMPYGAPYGGPGMPYGAPYPPPYGGYPMYPPPPPPPEQELEMLKDQAQYLQDALSEIQKRMRNWKRSCPRGSLSMQAGGVAGSARQRWSALGCRGLRLQRQSWGVRVAIQRQSGAMAMPTYDYRCAECGHTFEVFHGMKEDPVQECPKCGGAVQRLITGGAGIIFKGQGFYTTESRARNAPSCGRNAPCCGRDTPCDAPPCAE